MKLDGTYTFNAPRKRVWETLQNPESLRRAIPGVESFEQTGADEYQAKMKIGVGAIKGSYHGKIRVFDQQEPEHYKLSVDASGTPGFVRGEGTFELVEDGADKTIINWSADAQVGGLVASVGQRMLGGVAKMTVNQLWKSMETQIAEQQPK
ncbi:MAG TPA: carbon monoxide dehydrogenase subunit G [Chloroflexota bacterium]|nr:carbon monoxide dehydrogenase subunit G [Chloroflexota bacterium]